MRILTKNPMLLHVNGRNGAHFRVRTDLFDSFYVVIRDDKSRRFVSLLQRHKESRVLLNYRYISVQDITVSY